MSLRPKIALIVCAVVVSFAVVDYVVQRAIVVPLFERLELEAAQNDLQRAEDAIERRIQALDMQCRELASAEDAYDAILSGEAEERVEADVLYLCEPNGRAITTRIEDEGGKAVEVRELPRGGLAVSHPLFLAIDASGNRSARGLYGTDRGPLLVSARPLAAGGAMLVLGRWFTGAMRDEVLVECGVDLRPATSVPDGEQDVARRATLASGPVLAKDGTGARRLHEALFDVRHEPALFASVATPEVGLRAVKYAMISTVSAGLLILLVFLLLVQKTVLTPIRSLTQHAVEIGRNDELGESLGLDRDDEIGVLSREFDGMMHKLMKSREALLRTARVAGMSEIATGVLHNVGNVLNSVNVSASLVADKLVHSHVADLRKMTTILDEHADDLAAFIGEDDRGKHFRPFLAHLADKLISENESAVEELRGLMGGIEHIKRLVSSQQSYAGRSQLLERTNLHEEVEMALNITRSSRKGDVTVVREYGDFPRILVDRHKLMEILVNLIQNALQSLDEARPENPVLELRLREAGDGRVRIEVHDNGAGILEEDLARVFNHGFTTKPEGHGFGLHSSANAATEMGGRLWAESEGSGKGATFVLELPIQKRAEAA
jgi:signal transduction histidine kinase